MMNKRLSLSLLLIAVCLLFTTQHIVHAQVTYDDLGYAFVLEQGLVQELNLSQTQDDVNVTLSRMYADENRVILELGISAPLDRELPWATIKVEDSHGTAYDQYQIGGGSGGGAQDSQWSTQFSSFRVGEHWRAMDGNFVITVNLSDGSEFEFDVSIPVEPAVRVVWDTVVSASGVDIRFPTSSTTQSMTVITACYTLDSDQIWTPEAYISWTTELVRAGTYQNFEAAGNRETCFDIYTNLPYPFGVEQHTVGLSIPFLTLPRPHTIQNIVALQSAAEGLGITVEIVDTGNPLDVRYTVSEYTDEFQALVDNLLFERIIGPWLFEILGLP